MGKSKIKKDCFAYRDSKKKNVPFGTCNALKELYCRKEECAFYKPKKSKTVTDLQRE